MSNDHSPHSPGTSVGDEGTPGPGMPSPPPHGRGIVDGRPGDQPSRPQADPEVPAVGEWDKRRGDLPDTDATGF